MGVLDLFLPIGRCSEPNLVQNYILAFLVPGHLSDVGNIRPAQACRCLHDDLQSV